MGNVWCCRPNSYIIDYTHRKVVISQGIQCSLLIPSSYCSSHAFIPKSVCSPQRHCRCGVFPASGDWKPSFIPENLKEDQISPPMTLKSKLQSTRDDFIHENTDALVSLSETFSESSLEEFLTRKRQSQNRKNRITEETVAKLNCLPENGVPDFRDHSTFYKPLSSSGDVSCEEKPARVIQGTKRNRRRNRTRKRTKFGDRNSLCTSSDNSLSVDENIVIHKTVVDVKDITKKNDLNNSAETTSVDECKKPSETLYSVITPKKSILKNNDPVRGVLNGTHDNKDKENSFNSNSNSVDKNLNMSTHSDKYSNNSLPNRSVSVMSNHDSLDQLMSLLKSSTFTVSDDGTIKSKKSKSQDCINKSVNFTSDVSELKPYNECQQKTIVKSGYHVQQDGKMKKRFILRETHKLFDILNDPNDRRIRAICDRYQCDLEIFVRPPKIGLMYFAVEILAPDKYSLRMCVRELDSSMKWCISSQLF